MMSKNESNYINRLVINISYIDCLLRPSRKISIKPIFLLNIQENNRIIGLILNEKAF